MLNKKLQALSETWQEEKHYIRCEHDIKLDYENLTIVNQNEDIVKITQKFKKKRTLTETAKKLQVLLLNS